MDINRVIKKEIVRSLLFSAIGALALFLGLVLDFEKYAMIGIACGTIPTGIAMALIYQRSKNNPHMMKNIELEKEERNVFINNRAGYTAFWLSYLFVFLTVILINRLSVTLLQFSIFTLVLMPVLYFSSVAWYHKKY